MSRSARGLYDAKGLLNVATLLVFGSKIRLTSFEPQELVEISSTFVDALASLTGDDPTVEFHKTSRHEYAVACRKAAEFSASELPFRFRRNARELLGLPSASLPAGATFQPDRVRKIVETYDGSQLDDLSCSALEAKGDGAIEYMLASSNSLRAEVRRIIAEAKDWNEQDNWQIESFLRHGLNEALAHSNGAIYAPAISRAELIHSEVEFVMKRLEGELQSVARELNAELDEVPSIHALLLDRSKGDPKGILTEALELRGQARSLRHLLGRYVEALSDGRSSTRFDIAQSIREIGRELRYTLKVERAPTFLSAIDVSFVLGLPAVELSGSKLVEWLHHRLASRKLAVLTEAAKTVAFNQAYREQFAKLLEGSGYS